jgi:hypothetical protein
MGRGLIGARLLPGAGAAQARGARRRAVNAELRVAAEARESPRRRRNHNLHAEPDLVQRFLNVLQPGTYVRPHRHRRVLPGAGFECFVVLQGAIGLLLLNLLLVGAWMLRKALRADTAAVPTLVPGVDFSDHRSYWQFKYPAVMITDTAFFRNTAYHTARDTFDRLDYCRMAKVVLGVYQAIRALAWPKPM